MKAEPVSGEVPTSLKGDFLACSNNPNRPSSTLPSYLNRLLRPNMVQMALSLNCGTAR